MTLLKWASFTIVMDNVGVPVCWVKLPGIDVCSYRLHGSGEFLTSCGGKC
jgi:hypothetical protein